MSVIDRNLIQIGADSTPGNNWVIKLPDTPNGDLQFYKGTRENLGALRFTMSSAGIIRSAVPQSMVRVNTQNGHGSNSYIRRFVNATTQGTDITYADNAVSGASFTINTPGVYAISYTDSFSTSSDFGLSLNSNQLTLAIGSIAIDTKLTNMSTAGNSYRGNCGVTVYLSAGDVIRPHTAGIAASSAPADTMLTITRVA